ncbi:hypothetical protein [Duganella sp. HH101]|uniref:hypothetical protein n=1 Tax=Duganella sp. HH101 TaxID=1781066 RepID=UPI000892F467|nr:hypothetical protein [Duganella sp. HH101]OFA00210.1 OTU-like cysteine protease [Duganella sp. HH101]
MPLRIACWNILGKFTIANLADRLLANEWDLLIVLEPASERRSSALPANVVMVQRDVRGERIVLIYRAESIESLQAQTLDINGGRQAVLITLVTGYGQSYQVLTFHADYDGGSKSTSYNYVKAAMRTAQQASYDVVMGDFNTYSSDIGSSSRETSYENLTKGMATSEAGYPLDKVLVHRKTSTYPGHEQIKAEVVEQSNINLPNASAASLTTRNSPRAVVAKGRMGANKSDHRPVVLTLPSGDRKRAALSLKRKLDDDDDDDEDTDGTDDTSDMDDVDGQRSISLGAKAASSPPPARPKSNLPRQDPAKKSKTGLSPGQSKAAAAGGDAGHHDAPPSITPDGNCLFRCIAYIQYGDQERHAQVRAEIVAYVDANWATLSPRFGLYSKARFINRIRSLGEWGTEREAYVAAVHYGIRIRLISPDGYQGSETYGPAAGAIHRIYHVNGDHFELRSTN